MEEATKLKLELWQPTPRGRRPYAVRFTYRNSEGEVVAVDSRRRAYQGAKNLVSKAQNQLAEDLRDGDHLIAIEFVNWMDDPPDSIRCVNPTRDRRPLVKLSKPMRLVMTLLDESREDWVAFAKLRSLLNITTESGATSLHKTVQRLKEGHKRRPPLVETTLDGLGRLWIRSVAILTSNG